MPSSDARLAGMRLLLVEDNRDVAEMTAFALETYGAEVLCAFDGAQALAHVEAGPVDCAVLDLGLPDMRGVELAERLRAGNAAGRIVALSGFESADDDADQQPFDVYLQKPVSASALVDAVTAANSDAAGDPQV